MAKSKKSPLRSSVAFLFALGLLCRPFAVFADDYDYIPIDEFYMYNAYKYWELYGYNLDYTNTISYSQSYTGSYTYGGTISGTINGNESASFNVTLTGTSSSLDGNGGTTSSYNGLNNFDEVKFVLTPTDAVQESSMSEMTCIAYNPIAHTYNNDTNWNYDTFKCNQSNYNTTVLDDWEMTVEMTDGASGGITVGNIYLQLANQSAGGGSLNGTLALNQFDTVQGSGTILLDGTSTTTGHKKYDIPILSLNSFNNNFSYSKQINSRYKQDNIVIAVLSNNPNSMFSNITAINNQNETLNFKTIYNFNIPIGGYYLNMVEIEPNINTGYVFLYNAVKPTNLIPIYTGLKSKIPDDIYRFLYDNDRTIDAINNLDNHVTVGTNSTSGTVSNNNTITNSFNNNSDDLYNIENTWNDDMNNNLNNLDINSEMISSNKFLVTANWVRTQFERLVLNTPFELLLIYSLILGIALIFIGKVK